MYLRDGKAQMPKNTLRKVKWMLLFDSALKDLVVKAASRGWRASGYDS